MKHNEFDFNKSQNESKFDFSQSENESKFDFNQSFKKSNKNRLVKNLTKK